jgi:uncharacterized protein YcfL
MKTSLVVILALILVGCESSRRSASLTAEQATADAVRLANEKASALYQHQPFVAGQPAQFVSGHWLWTVRQTKLIFSYSTAKNHHVTRCYPVLVEEDGSFSYHDAAAS